MSRLPENPFLDPEQIAELLLEPGVKKANTLNAYEGRNRPDGGPE